jgi:hypothetical protein
VVRAVLALAAASLLVGCTHTGASKSTGPTTVDERTGVIQGVRFGDSAADIRRHLGKPTDHKQGFFPGGTEYTGPPAIGIRGHARPKTLHYDGLAFLVSPASGTFSMATLLENARTRAGVEVGDRLDRVRKRYKRVTCGEQSAGEPSFGGQIPKYRWCRTDVAGVRVFFGGDPIASITLTLYPPA